jgi:predicted RNase H-like nuclease (RuvC/YqgF family)
MQVNALIENELRAKDAEIARLREEVALWKDRVEVLERDWDAEIKALEASWRAEWPS